MSDDKNKYITTIHCCLTGCTNNSSCCLNPDNKNTYCTLNKINLMLDEDTGIIDCSQYKYNYEIPYECIDCQLDKHGEIEITIDPIFVEVDSVEDLLK